MAARRPARAVSREPPGHDPPRDQGHRQAHPRRHAAALEDRGLQLAAAPVGHRAEPARVQGRHRQPDGHPRERPDLGRRPGGARLGARRVLPGGPADPDARRVLGPRVDQRAGGDVRPPQGHRRAARRHQRVRHAQLQGGPARVRDPPRLAHPPGQPAHAADRQPAPHPPLLQLRPRRRPERQPAGGPHLHRLPAGRGAPVRDRAEAARSTSPWWTTCSRSAAATSSPSPASATPATGTARPCSPT